MDKETIWKLTDGHAKAYRRHKSEVVELLYKALHREEGPADRYEVLSVSVRPETAAQLVGKEFS